MERLEGKITELEEAVEELETDLDRAKKGKPPLKDWSRGIRTRRLLKRRLQLQNRI